MIDFNLLKIDFRITFGGVSGSTSMPRSGRVPATNPKNTNHDFGLVKTALYGLTWPVSGLLLKGRLEEAWPTLYLGGVGAWGALALVGLTFTENLPVDIRHRQDRELILSAAKGAVNVGLNAGESQGQSDIKVKRVAGDEIRVGLKWEALASKGEENCWRISFIKATVIKQPQVRIFDTQYGLSGLSVRSYGEQTFPYAFCGPKN